MADVKETVISLESGNELKFKWLKSQNDLIDDLGINEQMNLFLASLCARNMVKYVPMDTGMLSQNYEVYSDDEYGYIKYIQPYAHYIYTGINRFTGEDLEFNTMYHPLATSYWDKAMWNSEKDNIISKVISYRKRLSK